MTSTLHQHNTMLCFLLIVCCVIFSLVPSPRIWTVFPALSQSHLHTRTIRIHICSCLHQIPSIHQTIFETSPGGCPDTQSPFTNQTHGHHAHQPHRSSSLTALNSPMLLSQESPSVRQFRPHTQPPHLPPTRRPAPLFPFHRPLHPLPPPKPTPLLEPQNQLRPLARLEHTNPPAEHRHLHLPRTLHQAYRRPR